MCRSNTLRTSPRPFLAVGALGIAVAAVERDAALGGLASGAVQVLCTCDLISEGLDVPAIGAAILLRPTKSLSLHVQQVGRGMRPAAGKRHLIVLDHAGNSRRHGLPDDPHEWRLEGRPKRAGAAPIRTCPECGHLHGLAAAVCPACGHAYEIQRPTLRTVSGELREIGMRTRRLERLRTLPLRRLLNEAQTEADLREIAVARGYRRGWVRHVLREWRA